MNKKGKNIEQLFSESFNNFRVEPSSGLWKNISTKLAWKSFFSFNPTTFNAYYLSAILAVATAGVLLITKPVTETNQNINEITINKPIENTVITTAQDNETVPKEITTKTNTSKSSSSGKVLSNAENQKSESGINDQKPETRNPELVTRNPKLVTPNLEPETPNPKLASSTVVLTKVDNSRPITPKALFDIYPKNPVLPNDPISFINLSKNAVRYEWDFGDSESSDEFEPVHFYNKANNYTIKFKVWSEDGSMDSLVICYNFTNSAYQIEFPNAFTPNSNGPTNGYYTPGLPNNDVFHPVYKGVVEYHLSIFNRRGELIFESNDINVGWDGYINDRLVAQGVYIWKARGRYTNGQSFSKLGNVMLIKK